MRLFDVRFDDADTKIDTVVVAIALIDAFTGQVVRGNLRVSIEGIPNVPIVNLSGMYVFVNLPQQPSYLIHIDVEQEGYFNPEPIEFIPPAENDPDIAKKRRVDVMLERRPSAPLDLEATTVTGVVVRPGASVGTQVVVPFATVRVEYPEDMLPPGSDQQVQFKTRSDERGAFLLNMRLPADAAAEAIPVKFIFEITQNGQIDKRVVERRVKDLTFYGFDMVVDIEAPDIPVDLSGEGIPDLIEVAK